MAVRWSFLEFDWEQFRAVAPRLERAVDQQSFDDLDLPGVSELLEQVGAESTVEETCNTLVGALCGVDDPVSIESGLPELLRRMRRVPTGEEAAETLAELISAGPGIEPWFEAETGLVGILDVVQTFAVAVGITAYRENQGSPAAPRGIAAVTSWTRRLLPTEEAQDRVGELVELVRRAAERQHGLAALRED